MDIYEAAKFIAAILNDEYEGSDEYYELWQDMEASEPINNNFIMTLGDGTQFNIQVKKVSK